MCDFSEQYTLNKIVIDFEIGATYEGSGMKPCDVGRVERSRC